MPVPVPPLVLLACVLIAPAPEPAPQPAPDDWPAFLGPQGTGVSEATGLRDAVPDAAAVRQWTLKIGEGYSAPTVTTVTDATGARTPVVLTHRREDRREVIVCRTLDDGETRWERAADTTYRDPYGYNGGPRATPLVVRNQKEGGSVYTLGAAGRATCVDLATGEERWSRDFKADLEIPPWFFGVGGSPVYYEGGGDGGSLVIFAPGGQPNAGIVAVDPLTGKTVWSAVGRDTWDGVRPSPGQGGDGPYEWTGEEQVVSYSTPHLATIRGEPHLLCLVRQGLVSLDPRTGEERFRYWFRSRKYESVNAVRPVVVGDRILLCAAYEAGSVLLQVNDAGDGVTELWRKPDLLDCHWSTPVVHDGLIYGFAGRHEREGELQCVDLATGKLKWSEIGRDAVGPVTFSRSAGGFVNAAGEPVPFPDFGRGSCLLAPNVGAGGTLYILGERGTLFCARPSAEGYVERSRTAVPSLGYPAWTAPVLSHGRLLLTDEDTLTVLDLRASGEE